MTRPLLIIVLLLVSGAARAGCDGTIAGPVDRVVDGDTLDVRVDDGTVCRVRLWGIDAPEPGNEPGDRAAALVERLVGVGGGVRCDVPPSGQDSDRYGRAVRLCQVGDVDLADRLVDAGLAVDWPAYSGGFYRR